MGFQFTFDVTLQQMTSSSKVGKFGTYFDKYGEYNFRKTIKNIELMIVKSDKEGENISSGSPVNGFHEFTDYAIKIDSNMPIKEVEQHLYGTFINTGSIVFKNAHVSKLELPNVEIKSIYDTLMSRERGCRNYIDNPLTWSCEGKKPKIDQKTLRQSSLKEVPKKKSGVDFWGNNNNKNKTDITKVISKKDSVKLRYAPKTSNRTVLFVIDKSGSMRGQKLVDAKTSAISAAREALKRGAQVGVLSFSGKCSAEGLEQLAFTKNQQEISSFINSINAEGGTPLSVALRKAAEILQNAGIPKSEAVTVVLADGDDGCGGVAGAIKVLKDKNYLNRHETVGLEISENSDAAAQLRSIAKVSGGSYQSSAQSSELETVLVNAINKSILLDIVGGFERMDSKTKIGMSAADKLRAKVKARNEGK